ncbi:MAG: hypothetical protein WAV78_04635 [Xanthobacteraceae bacterium]|jgi:hypothetical protein
MIRKPSADWQRRDESAAVRTVRTAAAVAKGSATVARRGGHAVRGLLCYFFAIIWGFAGIASGLATGSLPSIIGIGAMAAFMFWAGGRAFAKARATSG